MTSKTEICVKAASLLKSSNIVINDVDDPQTVLETSLGNWYEAAKEVALSSSLWSFAIQTVRLSKNSETPGFGYAAKYNLPNDIVTPAQYYINNSKTVFHKDLEANVAGLYLLVKNDYDTIDMMYVAKVVEGYMTESFAAYLAAELALYASNEINASDSEISTLDNIREDLFNRAIKIDSSRRYFNIEIVPGNVSSTNPYGGGFNSGILQYEDI